MKSFRYLALATLVAFAACSESSTDATPVTGTISGTVSIGGSGASGITVSLSSGSTATTDGSGAYSFTAVPAGAYTITISDFASDVTFSATSKAATISATGATVNVDFTGTYIMTSSISGTITTPDGGVGGVAVKATGPDGDKSAVSDVGGSYSFNGLRAGTYTIEISNVPSGYTFATTSATVTVGVGEAKSAPFVGTKDAEEVDAQVIIKSVTKGTTDTPVNPAAVTGQIDVTLAIDPGSNTITKVCVLLDDQEVANGCQTLSSAAPGEEGAEPASTFEPVFSISTADFDGNTGEPKYLNKSYKLSAKLTLAGAKQSSVETSMQLTFANKDDIKITLMPEKSVVGTLGPNVGNVFFGGDQTLELLPVLYSGKSLQTLTMAFSGTGSWQTTSTFPGSVTFGADAGEPLAGYQSAAIDADFFKVQAALYTDGTAATALVGTLAGGPNGTRANIDEVAPPVVTLNLTDQTAVTVPAAGVPTQLCCSNNWVGPDYAFKSGLASTPNDAAGGVGYGATTFHVGAASMTTAEIAALPAVTKASDAGLTLSLVNTEKSVVAVYTDLLGNQSMTRLAGSGNNPLTAFGYDNTAPTDQAIDTLTDLADQVIFNAGPAPAAGPGPLTFSASEDRSGFSAVPLRAWMSQITAAGTTWPVGEVASGALVGPVNVASSVPVCAAAPMNTAPCTPNKTVADGYYHFEGTYNNQAGLIFPTWVMRDVLVDQTLPVQNNVQTPSQVKKNTQITVSALVTDNLDLWATSFGFDFGGDGVFVPLADTYKFQTNRWDVGSKTDLITSGTATVTVDAVVARERVDGTGAPDAASLASATFVRAITMDAAGNASGPVQNNFIAGTVDAGTDYGAGATPMTGWMVTQPSAAMSLCNGTGAATCGGGAVKSVTVKVVATGAAGTYPFPFGTSGKVWFYVNYDTPGGPVGGFYSAADTWLLQSPVLDGTSATIMDAANRTYTYTFTLTSDMVANVTAGTGINIVAVGFNPATGTALISEPQTVAVTVVAGS